MAARTRSRASCTAASGRPTTTNAGRPLATSTSTVTSAVSSPQRAHAVTRATERAVSGRSAAVIVMRAPCAVPAVGAMGPSAGTAVLIPQTTVVELASGGRAVRARPPDPAPLRHAEPLRARFRALPARHGTLRPVRAAPAAARIPLLRARAPRARLGRPRPQPRDDDHLGGRGGRDDRARLPPRRKALRRAHGARGVGFRPDRGHVLGLRRRRLSVYAARGALHRLRAPNLARRLRRRTAPPRPRGDGAPGG